MSAAAKDFSLESKVALITGASGILGPTFVAALLEFGAKVVGLDIVKGSPPAGKDRYLFVECDISDPEQVAEAVSASIEQFGQIDTTTLKASHIQYPLKIIPWPCGRRP